MSEPWYPKYTAANWMELLFHFPFKSEGFYSEYRPDHPNINEEYVQAGFGPGGFGKLSFSDYLLLIALDNGIQNWEGEIGGASCRARMRRGVDSVPVR